MTPYVRWGLVLTTSVAALICGAVPLADTIGTAEVAAGPVYDETKVSNPMPMVPATNAQIGGFAGALTVGADGAANYSLPLQPIPGPASMTPALSLDYNSRSGNGYLGVGFVVSGPQTISRCAKTLAQDGVNEGIRLDAKDRFCLGTLRLVATAGAYGANGTTYRTDPETFTRVKSFRVTAGSPDDGPDYFEVRTKDGLIHTYGYVDTNGTFDADIIDSRRISWPIMAMRDRVGNRVEYVYSTLLATSGDPSLPGQVVAWRHLDEILYGNFSVVNGRRVADRKVKFTYETRPDPIEGYAFGERRLIRDRLKSIEMQRQTGNPGNGTFVNARSYHLRYYVNQEFPYDTGYSKLASVQECGPHGTTCLPSTKFVWQRGQAGFQPGQLQLLPAHGPDSPVTQLLVMDFNGDGADDLAYPGQLIHSDAPGDFSNFWIMQQSDPHQAAPFDGYVIADQTKGGGSGGGYAVAWAIDYDLDGIEDLLPGENAGKLHTGSVNASALKNWRPILSRPTGFYPVNTGFQGPINGVGQFRATPEDPIESITSFARFADFDGDGRQDTLEYVGRDISGGLAQGWYVRFRTGNVSSSISGPTPDSTTGFDDQAFTPPQRINSLNHREPRDMFLLDMNGDGQTEILFHEFDLDLMVAMKVTRDGQTTTELVLGLPGWIPYFERIFLDVNGDGLSDLLTHVGGTADPPSDSMLFIRFNTGRGFGIPEPIASLPAGLNVKFKYALIVDYNSDGREDLLFGRHANVEGIDGIDGMHLLLASNDGAGGATFQFKSGVISFTGIQDYPLAPVLNSVVSLDADGDGLDDLLVVERNADVSETRRLMYYRHHKAGEAPDRLIGITEGNNGLPTVEITYTPLSTHPETYQRSNCDHKQYNCTIPSYYVVSEVRRDAGLESPVTMVSEYSYKNSITDRTSRKWLGFAEQRVKTFPSDGSSQPTTTRNFYSNIDAKRDPRLIETWTYGGMPGYPKWLERYRQDWGKRDIVIEGQSLPYQYVALSETWSYQFPEGSTTSNIDKLTPADIGESYIFRKVVNDQVLEIDNFGNVRQRRSHVDAGGAYQTRVSVDYDIDIDAWLLARPKKIRTWQINANCGSPSQCEEASMRTVEVLGYRPSAQGLPTNLPQSLKHFHTDNNPDKTTTVAYEYDRYGNVISTSMSGIVDAQGTNGTRTSYVTYDPDGVFPHAVRNTLGHTSYIKFDPLLGTPTIEVDPNGLRTDVQYDTLGRPVTIRMPNGSETRTRYAVEVFGISLLAMVEVTDAAGGKTQTVYDRVGRPIIERFKGFDSVMRVQTRAFDAVGMLRREDSAPVSIDTSAPPAVIYTYDDRGRKRTQLEPNENNPAQPYKRTWSYEKNTVTYTDSRGHITKQEYDQAGHLGRVTRALGTLDEVTREYTYGPFGRLLDSRLVNRPETASVYAWDYRGNPLMSEDPDRGRLTNQYNAFNEPILAIDANGRQRIPRYDALGRIEQMKVLAVSENTSVLLSDTQYNYDFEPSSHEPQLGKLTRVQRQDYVSTDSGGNEQTTSTSYDYDTPLGRLATATHVMPSDTAPNVSASYSFNYGYDSLDRLKSIQYPQLPGQTLGSLTVSYRYASSNGQLMTVDATEGASLAQLWALEQTDQANRPIRTTTGDGIVKLTAYDWRGMLKTQHLESATDDACASCPRSGLRYTYDGEGNLDSRQDLLQGATERFGYDALDRLTKMSMGSLDTPWETWSYDKLDNIIANTHRGVYVYADSSRPMRITQVVGGKIGTTRNYGYDAVGNQIIRPGGTVLYNDMDLPARLLGPGDQKIADFLYDASGSRLRKTTSTGAITTYIGGLYEQHRQGLSVEHRLIVPGIAVLPYRHNGTQLIRQPVRYLHTDHLGSTEAITVDEDLGPGRKAVVKEQRSYDAFGLPRNPDWLSNDYSITQSAVVTQGYTSHNDDTELGLIDMKGRVYDPTLARFLTPDPVTGPATNPYAYVGNNPLRYTDPSGFLKCVAGKVGSSATWLCGDSSGGGPDGGDPYFVDIRTGDRVVDIHIPGNSGHPDEGPIGHPASRKEQQDLLKFSDRPARRSGVSDMLRYGVQVAQNSAMPTIASDADAIAYLKASCGPGGRYCADEVTIYGFDGWDFTKRFIWHFLGNTPPGLAYETVNLMNEIVEGTPCEGPLGAAQRCFDISSHVEQQLAIGGALHFGGQALKRVVNGIKSNWLKNIEFSGPEQDFVSDAKLKDATGKGPDARRKALDAILKEDFPDLNFTYTPQYSPYMRTGVAQRNTGTHIGKARFFSREVLRDVIVHEELHHRWWARGINNHHPRGSANEAKFYGTIERYKRLRGWNDGP